MDPALAGRIREWDARPVPGGFQGLRELADAGFSGVVTTGTAWLFMLNGRVVGVVDGTLSNFETGESTAHEAPDPSLPLLFAMRERDGETRAKYYTDDNPLSEVHETLTDAGFTGYIELSENVLSGDYYVVYYGGRSMSVAFVGSGDTLLTGDEAFRQAAEEVGIYEVIDVDLEVRDVPEPDGPDEPAEDAPGGGRTAGTSDETAHPDAPSSAEPADVPPSTEPAEPAPEPDDRRDGEETADEPGPAGGPDASTPEDGSAVPDPDTERSSGGGPAAGADPDDPFSEEAAWRETRTIPALDPDESDGPAAAEDGGQQAATDSEPAPAEPEPTVDEDRIAELEAAIEAQSETIAELEARLESTSAEAEQLREEREQVRDELESARAGTAGGEAPAEPATGQPLDPDDALDQTDLFVRYDSKAGGTLEKAHDGVLDREEVVGNLRIDHHTRFDQAAVTVGGRDFEAFLDATLEYRFVDWLVTELLFEIQDTGGQRGLRELFDAIPRIDRAEFQGTVTWRDQDAGETYEEPFDVVCRDRMGEPLVVANLNDVRDPATGDMMTSLIEGASAVAEGVESLGAAFLVTSSFFQPDALETAGEATGGGLFSREKRWSYVKLSRSRGYHLCLVEARGDNFHVAVPEL
ncbi:MAG: hypothetical protein ABEJ92_02510 [Halobacteriales archaeon]